MLLEGQSSAVDPRKVIYDTPRNLIGFRLQRIAPLSVEEQ